MNNIALSTALSRDVNWDPLYSLGLTKKYSLDSCQVYLGDNFTNNAELTREIMENYNLNIILHSPVSLNRDSLDEELIKKILEFKRDESICVVYHHDFNVGVGETLEIVELLNQKGIAVLLENFYESKDQIDVRSNVESYKRILIESHFKGLELYPLLDIPRLFINGINSIINPYDETLSILNLINSLGSTLYLHLIDAKDDEQSRESWCPIGMGYIPYKKIFNHLIKCKIKIPLIILEYEDEDHVKESLDYLGNISKK